MGRTHARGCVSRARNTGTETKQMATAVNFLPQGSRDIIWNAKVPDHLHVIFMAPKIQQAESVQEFP